jgi:hypothetical protein
MLRTTLVRSACLAAVLALGGLGSLHAQDAKWENTVTLYGWGANMSGTAGVGPVEASVDVPFSDIWDNLKMGAMFNYMGRGQTFVTGLDFIYMKLGSDVATPNTGATIAEVKLKQWLMEADGGYRVTPWMDALIGIRVPVIETEIVPDVNLPNVSTKSSTESWFAPLIGARIMLPVGSHLTVIGRGDIGGFGIGGTNNTWQGAGYLNYGFGKGWSASLGYRAINADYATGTKGEADYFLYNVTNYGPVIGFSYKF